MKTLIVVDMQKGFINKNNEFLIESIQHFLNENKFDKVIFTKYKNKQNGPFINILGWNGLCDEDSQQFVVEYNKNELIEKYSYGISCKEIEKLKEQNIEEVYLCGTDIDACILNIAFNLFDNNIKPIFIKELCATSSNNVDISNCAWAIIERNFGRNCIASIKEIY